MCKVTVAVKHFIKRARFCYCGFIHFVTGVCKVGETKCKDKNHENYMKCLNDTDGDCVPNEKVMYIACIYMHQRRLDTTTSRTG